MEKVSLYRKYRPHNFDNLVGQDYIKTTLINALKNNNVSHAYLFTGPRGTGKTSTARLIAKALNCTNLQDDYEPCDECEFCTDINEGRLIDIIEIDAASNRGIDEVRDLKEKISFAPSRSKYKVYIVDEVHMMTKEAFNALLKTLEEPPSHAYFILATTEVHKVPETIISRCQRFDFKRISKKALMTRLNFIAQKENIKVEDSALEVISRYVDGGLRDAIGLLEQLTVNDELTFEHVQEILGLSSFSFMENLYEAILAMDSLSALKIVNELHSQGSDFRQFLHEFINLLREKMLESISKDEQQEASRLIKMIEVFQEAQIRLESDIPQLPLEMAIIKLTGKVVEYSESNKKEKEPEVEVKEKKTSKKEKKTEDNSAEILNLPLTISYLKENWPRITERVKIPALRMSLKGAVPSMVDDFNVTLEFNTKFHKDKVMEHDNRVELETLIKEMFNKPVKIHAKVKELEIKSVMDEESDIADQALEIFGGELID